MNKNELIQEIKVLMVKKGIDVKTMSEKTGIPRTTLYRFLRNENTPNIGIIINILKSLGCEILINEKGGKK